MSKLKHTTQSDTQATPKAMPGCRWSAAALAGLIGLIYELVTASWTGFGRMVLRMAGVGLLIRLVAFWLGYAEAWLRHKAKAGAFRK